MNETLWHCVMCIDSWLEGLHSAYGMDKWAKASYFHRQMWRNVKCWIQFNLLSSLRARQCMWKRRVADDKAILTLHCPVSDDERDGTLVDGSLVVWCANWLQPILYYLAWGGCSAASTAVKPLQAAKAGLECVLDQEHHYYVYYFSASKFCPEVPILSDTAFDAVMWCAVLWCDGVFADIGCIYSSIWQLVY